MPLLQSLEGKMTLKTMACGNCKLFRISIDNGLKKSGKLLPYEEMAIELALNYMDSLRAGTITE
ncbi:hypothetical protein AYI85_03900 [Shewanella algae]|nr:hypothetical protein AYI85_03900 [Shewanella algae]TVL06733.1 hypothetical protein AYI84_01575 [Shewanella algae]TVL49201.1 hypothetical protein AYI99_17685 [Shewanella algae]TVO88163.1 hypothetical protein AYI76_02125 [Shewanella algae]TVO89769.1 hypothetical protein AYI78_02125 [Shewanella algae]